MRLLVIGGVAAGLSAASRARRLDPDLDIIVLEKGDTISYGACGLPYFIEGRVRDWRQLLVYSPEYFERERRIRIRTGAEAAEISPVRGTVRLTSGETLAYDRLVVATGAVPRRPFPPGPNVFALNNLADAQRLHAHLAQASPGRAAVIGAGYIGIEAAEALRARGWQVRLLHRGQNLLHRHDPELTRRLVSILHRHRIPVEHGVEVTDPRRLSADLIVVAAGLQPNAALAAAAQIELGPTGAIRVDAHLQTSAPHVFAVGDCAESFHRVTGRPVWIPLGTTANKMGRIAGANVTGALERFRGVVGTSIVRVCGIGVALTGLSVHHARQEGFDPVEVWIDARERARYFRGRPTAVQLVADKRTSRLLGGAVIGEYGVEGRINVIASALTSRMLLDDFESLDLAYAPPFSPVWDPVLIAAQQLARLLK